MFFNVFRRINYCLHFLGNQEENNTTKWQTYDMYENNVPNIPLEFIQNSILLTENFKSQQRKSSQKIKMTQSSTYFPLFLLRKSS